MRVMNRAGIPVGDSPRVAGAVSTDSGDAQRTSTGEDPLSSGLAPGELGRNFASSGEVYQRSVELREPSEAELQSAFLGYAAAGANVGGSSGRPLDVRDVRTGDDARRFIEQRRIGHVKIALTDIDGLMRGKYISSEKFLSGLDKGLGFCDAVLGWDLDDQLYDNTSFSGLHSGFPDASTRLVIDSCREVWAENNTVLFLLEFAGAAAALCPRATLRRVIQRADALGLVVKTALEYEFSVFDETPQSVREKGFKNLKPITPGWFGYSSLRQSTEASLYHKILALGKLMDFPLESMHEETGPGMMEAALCADTPMNAADKAVLFKTYLKILCQLDGKMASFMPKLRSDYPGQGGHIHMSLRRKSDDHPLLFQADGPNGLSDTARYFLGGQQRYLPDFLALVAPTVNSYSRLLPGLLAPTNTTWGLDNRTAGLRVVGKTPQSCRIELRVAGADANPYLALAAMIAAGIAGIERKIEPTTPVQGNAYHHKDMRLATTLWEAAQCLRASEVAREYLGNTFVDHFVSTREWEEREFRKYVTDWELNRYFEVI